MKFGTRLGLGIVGVVVLVAGLMARAFEQEYSSLGYVVLRAPDGVVGAYQPDETVDGPFEIVDGEDGAFSVVREGATLFTGTEEEAAFWIETKGASPAFTGTSGEVEAWVGEQEAAEDDGFWPLALIVAGGLLVLGAVALGGGWGRSARGRSDPVSSHS
ncbi:MAG TPA: hypothetical protein VLD62_05260 [Acidimicrobiia bacterium]|nr:hypothetical protein [Acidimicrobiia bacterium]